MRTRLRILFTRRLWGSAAVAIVVGCANFGTAFAQGDTVRDSSRVAPDSFLVALETSRGSVTVAIHRQWAPLGVDRFYYLLQHNFYDEARFFRVVPNSLAQFGMPAELSLAEQFASTPILDDSVRQSNRRGTISYASAGPNTRRSQLFINLKDNTQYDTYNGIGFPPIGEIRQGMEFLDQLNTEYGQTPSQRAITKEGNAYLNREFPRLDYIRTARIMREWR